MSHSDTIPAPATTHHLAAGMMRVHDRVEQRAAAAALLSERRVAEERAAYEWLESLGV